MSSPAQVLKNIGPKLVPFLKTVAVYFVLFIPEDNPSMWSMFIKCAPILSLIFFVALHGLGMADEYKYSRRILLGLVFSCIGDALLIWPNYFLHGMLSFAVAQIFYVTAFGFNKLNLPLGIPLYSMSIYVVSILLRKASAEFVVGVPVYSFLLITMAWRGLARVQLSYAAFSWTQLCACLGGLFFVASDAFIGFHRFNAPIANAQLLIMSTYYLAQFGIALSVVDSSTIYKQEQKKILIQKTSDNTAVSSVNKTNKAKGKVDLNK